MIKLRLHFSVHVYVCEQLHDALIGVSGVVLPPLFFKCFPPVLQGVYSHVLFFDLSIPHLKNSIISAPSAFVTTLSFSLQALRGDIQSCTDCGTGQGDILPESLSCCQGNRFIPSAQGRGIL